MGKKRRTVGKGTPPSALSVLLTDEKSRPVAVRYLVTIASTLLTLLAAALPMVKFRTVGGDSDAHSVFYWMNANFYGVDGTKGAYESLVSASSGNQSLGFYRAVVVTYIAMALLIIVGSVATVLTSVGACYLLADREESARGKKLGRFYRVLFGNRWMTLLPPLLLTLPLLFPRLLAYYNTALVAYEARAVFAPFDPFIIAVLLFLTDLLVLLYTKDRERRLKYDIFRSPARRVTAEDLRRMEDEAWEAEVRADRDRTDPPAVRETSKDGRPKKTEPKAEPKKPDPSEEELYGKRFVVGGDAPTADAETSAPLSEEKHSDGEKDGAMRSSLESLFREDEPTERPSRKKKKK